MRVGSENEIQVADVRMLCLFVWGNVWNEDRIKFMFSSIDRSFWNSALLDGSGNVGNKMKWKWIWKFESFHVYIISIENHRQSLAKCCSWVQFCGGCLHAQRRWVTKHCFCYEYEGAVRLRSGMVMGSIGPAEVQCQHWWVRHGTRPLVQGWVMCNLFLVTWSHKTRWSTEAMFDDLAMITWRCTCSAMWLEQLAFFTRCKRLNDRRSDFIPTESIRTNFITFENPRTSLIHTKS